MKDIPVFATDFGVASLVLRDIPYSGTAYVQVQATLSPEPFLQECRSFCRSCGAETVYATGHPSLEHYPFHTALWQMNRLTAGLPDTDGALWPVLPENLEDWLAIYNQRMAGVPNAAHMTISDGRAMLSAGEGYFVHQGRAVLGIGRVSGSQLCAAASAVPGAGRDVVLTLCHAVTDDVVTLVVASENRRAVSLYQSLGFTLAQELSRWYCICPARADG